jgi:hypothetical protein
MKVDVPLQLRYGGVALLFLGPVLILLAGGLILAAKSTQTWPTTDARVIRSEIEVSQKASGIRRGQARFSDYFNPLIQYTYVVNGEQYNGTQIRSHSDAGGYDRAEVEQWIRKYPVDATISIHYSPKMPQRSVIDTTADVGLFWTVLVFGILAIPGGLVLRRVGLPQQPAEKPESVPLSDRSTDEQTSRQPSVALSKSKPRHWLIRAVAALLGLALFLFGGLGVIISIQRYIEAGNAVDPGDDVSLAVRIITAAIFGVLAVCGALLIWKGIRQSKPFASQSSISAKR